MTTTGLIGGVYEVGVGVPDADAAVAFWRACGYRVGTEGGLGGAQAKALYGVDSGLRSIRLFHQDATAGLVRLMVWDRPVGAGLDMAPLRTHGCRWSVHRTDDIANAYVHGEMLRRQGKPITLLGRNTTSTWAKRSPTRSPLSKRWPRRATLCCFSPTHSWWR